MNSQALEIVKGYQGKPIRIMEPIPMKSFVWEFAKFYRHPFI